MSEEEFGQEFDRVARAAMMALGQVREALSRRAAERDRQRQQAMQAAIREQEQRTARVRELVGRQDFWAKPSGERVANAATLGATLYATDKNAAAIYDTVRDQAYARYGVDVDELRSRFPESEDARRAALLHAIDDRLAALRNEQLARDERAAAADRRLEADAERQRADEAAENGRAGTQDAHAHDQAADALDHDATSYETNADGHAMDRDLHRSAAAPEDATANAADGGGTLGAPTTPAGRVRQQVGESYPQSAKQALAQSPRVRAPKPKKAKQQRAPQRTAGLSR
ncbi:hypothetical protein C5C03_00410 [Clavibacter michiganensis]|uniref:hypothetical protein n=1 Tax=Clavibacter michiganensis TaxID=28447 RepID=UPI000CE83B50|nr:hypothetical protein [Clavibacter michiganensis]PPF91320.1 hypothetical protein C5C03_00410 [Clavibacter michiganensis]PPF99362.1 hypothetical protein C5C05_02210 [Clavibacter michiganensis]